MVCLSAYYHPSKYNNQAKENSLFFKTHTHYTETIINNIRGWPEKHMPLKAGQPWLHATQNNYNLHNQKKNKSKKNKIKFWCIHKNSSKVTRKHRIIN